MKHILYILVALLITTTSCSAADPLYSSSNISNDLLDVTLNDTDGDPLGIDSVTNALIIIDYEHHEIHAGSSFTVIESTELGNGATFDVLIQTPDTTKWAHLVWEIEHELETQFQFYSDTVYTDNGTAINAFNRDANSSKVSTTLVYHTPTIGGVGNLTATIVSGSGKKSGGGDRLANEFILKQDCAYLIRITNLTANNNWQTVKLNWYEHTSK